MRDDFDEVVADQFKLLDQIPVPDTWSKVRLKVLDESPVEFNDPIDQDMTVAHHGAPSPTSEGRSRHRWMLTAAAVLLFVILAVVFVERDSRQPAVVTTPTPPAVVTTPTPPAVVTTPTPPAVVTTPTPPDTAADAVAPDVPEVTVADEEVARGFLEAYVANDADQALDYITESAIVAAGMWGSMEEFRGDIAWNEATGYKTMINDCAPLDDEPEAGITLRCGFDFHLFGSDALGNDPVRDNYWDLTIRDGQIVAADKVTPASNGWPEEWASFQSWIEAEYPDDATVLYDGQYPYEPQYSGWRRLTADALQLWEQRTQEYVQTVPPRRESYAADVAAYCATRAPQHRELTVFTDETLDQVATEYTAAAAVVEQTIKELGAIDVPRSTLTPTVWFQHQLLRLQKIAEESAIWVTAGDATRLAELNAEYHELRQNMTGGPYGTGLGSGLEECLASLPS